jgi:hypothetical protein
MTAAADVPTGKTNPAPKPVRVPPAVKTAAPLTAQTRGAATTPASSSSTAAYAPPQTPPPTAPPVVASPVVESPAANVAAPKMAAPTAATVEAPTLGEIRAVADQILRQVRSGTLRPSSDLLQFFNDGADHRVELRTSPPLTEPEQGRVHTQFELALTRFSAGGIKESRFVVVRIDVAKRNGTVEVLDKVFGPLTRSSMR